MDPLKLTLTRNLLKHVCATKMFTDDGAVAGCRRNVLVELEHIEHGRATILVTGQHFDTVVSKSIPEFQYRGFTVEVTDGRALFSRSESRQAGAVAVFRPLPAVDAAQGALF